MKSYNALFNNNIHRQYRQTIQCSCKSYRSPFQNHVFLIHVHNTKWQCLHVFQNLFFFTCTCMEKIFELKVQTSKVLFIFTYHLYKSLRSSPACRCTWMTQWYLYSCLREDTDSSSTHSCLPWQKIHTVQEVNSSFQEIIFQNIFRFWYWFGLLWILRRLHTYFVHICSRSIPLYTHIGSLPLCWCTSHYSDRDCCHIH